MPTAIVAFILGALIAGLGVWALMARDAARSFVLFALGDSVRAETRAIQAYQHEPPAVAIWELRHLADLQHEYAARGVDDGKTGLMHDVITHGRLAGLYRTIGDQSNTTIHANIAIQAFLRATKPGSPITNAEALLGWIQLLDQRTRPEGQYGLPGGPSASLE